MTFKNLPLALLLAGCLLPALPLHADLDGVTVRPATPQEIARYYKTHILDTMIWNPAAGVPISRIEVQLGNGKLLAYQGTNLVVSTVISTGREGYGTQPGDYSVIGKDPTHHSNLYGDFCDAHGNAVSGADAGETPPAGLHYEGASMPWYLRLTDAGLGIHAGFVNGNAISHGCIRLPPELAEKFYRIVSVGTPVKIVR